MSESVFAKCVRDDIRGTNRSGIRHAQEIQLAVMPYRALEDKDAFHEIAETMRLRMIEALREHGAPINVWRAGALHGNVTVPISRLTGELGDMRDEHYFRVRVRASVEALGADA